jgi:hypothetical protein
MDVFSLYARSTLHTVPSATKLHHAKAQRTTPKAFYAQPAIGAASRGQFHRAGNGADRATTGAKIAQLPPESICPHQAGGLIPEAAQQRFVNMK